MHFMVYYIWHSVKAVSRIMKKKSFSGVSTPKLPHLTGAVPSVTS